MNTPGAMPNTDPLMYRIAILFISTLLLSASASASDAELIALGRALFFDTTLSANRTQSCATCHVANNAFTDSRQNAVGGAVSVGDDQRSMGDRNAPTLTYAALTPQFGLDESGLYVGGFFHDGRAATLEAQAAEPFINPLEMALPDVAAVVGRVAENRAYRDGLEKRFGTAIFLSNDSAMKAITTAIATFERSDEFSTFDSRYDRSLRGEEPLTPLQEVGRKLFYSQLFNCHSCHLIDSREFVEHETFTNFRYHNIGVPVNDQVRRMNGLGARYLDPGLNGNPGVDDVAMSGKFKVPTLRNVAVTGPYMHNGVFEELETVILFYNKFTLSNAESQINPETGEMWGTTEYPDTIDLDLLGQGQPISSLHVDALVAFLEALTDQRYEHLLEQN